MIIIEEWKSWIVVTLAFVATFSWRFLGLVLAERISPNGLLMRWINAVAYSMVAGVLILILINPTGILLTSSLKARLLGLFSGVLAIYLTRNILFSILTGIIVFIILNKF